MNDCAGCRLSSPATCPFVRVSRGAGSRLFRAGDRAEALYRLARGEVLLHRGEEALALRSTGALVGIDALRGGQHRTDATCNGEVLLCVLATSRLPAFAGSSPGAALALAHEAAEEAERWRTAQVDHLDCTARLAAFLLQRAPGAAPLPRVTLAALLRMRPETLSRCVGKLAQRGAVEPSTLEVRRHDELRRAMAVEEI